MASDVLGGYLYGSVAECRRIVGLCLFVNAPSDYGAMRFCVDEIGALLQARARTQSIQACKKQIEHLLTQGAPRHCVLADAGHGVDTAFRARLRELGLRLCVGVTGSVTVWPPGREPLPAPAPGGRGRRVGKLSTRLRLGGIALPQHHPQSIKALALQLGPKHWHTVTWRAGTNAKLRSRLARVRVRVRVRAAHRDQLRDEVREPEWLLIEWPRGDTAPLKYWRSTLPEDTPLTRMVYEAKMRWRIERDYQDLKQALGLGHLTARTRSSFSERVAAGDGGMAVPRVADTAKDRVFQCLGLAVLPQSGQVRPGARQSQHRVAACRVPQRTDAWALAVACNPILPQGIDQDGVDDPRSLTRPLVEVALGALLHQRPILPVVAGMAKCSDQIAVPGQCLRQHAVPEFGAADAVRAARPA